MKEIKNISRTRAQVSSAAVERMYITMRHLFNRGFYKPMGVSGDTLREALLELRPEIYGTIAEEKVELNGLLCIIEANILAPNDFIDIFFYSRSINNELSKGYESFHSSK